MIREMSMRALLTDTEREYFSKLYEDDENNDE